MRNALVFILFIISLGCTPIDKLEPNQTDTFLKFYGETNKMESKDLAVLSDGYLILSTYTDTTTLLLKTDALGNKIWAKSFDNFKGNSLVEISEGYILIGDSINNQIDPPLTYMKLIKTNTQGDILASTELGSGIEHGFSITQTFNNDIIALGCATPDRENTYITINGFDNNLTSIWVDQNYSISTGDLFPSKSIYESGNNLTWLSSSVINGDNKALNISKAPAGDQSPSINDPILGGNKFSNLDGDFVQTTDGGFAIVKSVINGTKSNIAFSYFNGGDVSSDNIIDLGGGNQYAYSIENGTNGLLIVATTDIHEDDKEGERTDNDLLLLEVNYNGSIKTNGINITYGGIGNEVPVRIRRTNDGGYAVLGTLTNSKDAQQTFLLKTDSKGKLN